MISQIPNWVLLVGVLPTLVAIITLIISRKLHVAVISAFLSLIFVGIFIVTSFMQDASAKIDVDVDTCKTQISNKYDIKSLNVSTSFSGSFVIGTGTFYSRMFFVTYVKTSHGLHLKKIPYNLSYIIEYDGPPKLKELKCKVLLNSMSWLGSKKEYSNTRVLRYIIYVPKGTVIEKYKL